MTNEDIACELFRNCESGLTIRLDGTIPDKGFAVGRIGYELRAHRSILNIDMIRAWVDRARRLHEHLYHNDSWGLGIWRDGEHIYLDVSNIIPNRARAEELGRDRRQIAIYDLERGEEIRL